MAAPKPTYNDDIGLPDIHYNPLQNYRNVTYNTRLTMMPAKEATLERPLRSYDFKKGIIMWETGGAGTVFLEELQVETVGTGSATGAYASQQFHNFSGKLVEPIGGRFIEALSLGALTLGYANNSGAVYLFEIYFSGYNPDSDMPEQCKGWDGEELIFRWYVTLKELKMKLDYKGSTYDFTMFVSTAEAGLSDHTHLEQGFKMEGSPNTIGEFCTKLEKALNDREKEKVKSQQRCHAHVYKISAHKEIANLKYDYGLFSLNTLSFGMYKGQIQVPSGTTIQSFVLSSMPNSKDILKFLHKVPEKKDFNSTNTKKDTMHLIAKNFSIISGSKDLEKGGNPLFDNRIGTTAKEVHYFITTKEDAKNVIGPQEYEDAWETTNRDKRVDNWIKKGLLRKVYKWIYTGENTEVINCDIKLDYLWRTVRPLWLDKDGNPVSAQAQQPAAKASKGGSPAPVACIDARSVQAFNDGKSQLYVEDMPYKEGQDLDINPKKGWYPHMPQTSIVNTTVQEGSGQGALSPQSATEYSVFRQLGNGQATGVEDMFQITLEVVGDPYWLFQIPGKPGAAPWEEDVWEYEKEQLTEDMMAEKRKKTASHNWLPFIYFQAQAPSADLTADDLMNLRKADAITGIFSAKKVTNKFVKGKFTTTLECFRDQLSNPWGKTSKKSTSSSFTPKSGAGEASATGPTNASPPNPSGTYDPNRNDGGTAYQPGEREYAQQSAAAGNLREAERVRSGATTTVIGQVPVEQVPAGSPVTGNQNPGVPATRTAPPTEAEIRRRYGN
jgi:hypothetical protein